MLMRDGRAHRAEQPAIATVPDDWAVWAFSDLHAVLDATRMAFREAGLVDAAGHWSAPPRTALVGCGDYLDRGPQGRGLVDFLRRLADEAGAAGGTVQLARGNHEHQLHELAMGRSGAFGEWLLYGGQATLDSWDVGPLDPDDPRATILRLDAVTPGLIAWLGSLPHAVRWRDVLFVHGGLVPGRSLDDLGRMTDAHLLIRAGFYDEPWESGAFAAYEAAGIRRVVFGHTAQAHGARLFHGGRSLALDTNACGALLSPPDAIAAVTLVRLEGDQPFDAAEGIVVGTAAWPSQPARKPLQSIIENL